MSRKKVLLVEINKVTWTLIDPLIERGRLPTFARLKREGTWAAPMSVDLPPQLDPWITWTTVYTAGRKRTTTSSSCNIRPKSFAPSASGRFATTRDERPSLKRSVRSLKTN